MAQTLEPEDCGLYPDFTTYWLCDFKCYLASQDLTFLSLEI